MKNVLIVDDKQLLHLTRYQHLNSVSAGLAEKPEEIDEKAVEEAKKRAEAALEQTLTDEEYAVSLATVEKALAQLKVKRRHHIH